MLLVTPALLATGQEEMVAILFQSLPLLMSQYKVSHHIINICNIYLFYFILAKPVVQFTIVGPAIGVEFSDIYLSINITRDLPSVLPQDINWFYGTTTNNRTLLTGGGGSMSGYALSEDRLSLEIFNLSLSNSGVYTAEASNIVGTGSSNITLTVQSKRIIE